MDVCLAGRASTTFVMSSMANSSTIASRSGSPLLAALCQQLKLRHYSERTARIYAGWVVRYIKFHGKRHPSELGREHIVEFLSWLAIQSNVSASTQNQVLAAIAFLYREVLRLPLEDVEQVARAKRPVRLPVVLTRDEVRRVIGEMEGAPQLAAVLLYGSGLRVLECLQLRVKDIDFAAHQILVRGGKGNKDRITMLPESSSRYCEGIWTTCAWLTPEI